MHYSFQSLEPDPVSSLIFEYWRSSIDRLWYWHLRTAGNQKIAQGEAYATKDACMQAIQQVRQASGAAVQDLSPREK